MAKITLDNVGSLISSTTAVTTINNNSAAIEDAFENTLSRDGTAPNQMEAPLDMNSQQIMNLPKPIGPSSPLRLQELSDFLDGGTVSNIPDGGTTGQVLAKDSDADFDLGWRDSVTSVGLTMPSDFLVTNPTITTAGTFAVTRNSQTANRVLASPSGSNGTPTYRNLDGKEFGTNGITLDTGADYGGLINAKRAPGGASLEFGYDQANTTATLGAYSVSGRPYVGFHCGPGTNSNTFKTQGTAGSVFMPDGAGGFYFASVPTASADNQTPSNIMSLSASTGLTLNVPLSTGNGGTGAITASAARTNLGLAIGTNVQAWNTNLDTYATKTPPSGTVVGTTDTQTLTNKTLTSPTINTPVTSGVTDGSAAAAGKIGEYISSTLASGSATALTTGTAKTITSISLTAGDWDVNCVGHCLPANTTSLTNWNVSISTTNNTLDATPGHIAGNFMNATVFPGTTAIAQGIPNVRISLTTTTTIYLVMNATFTVSTCSGFGIIQARRVR